MSRLSWLSSLLLCLSLLAFAAGADVARGAQAIPALTQRVTDTTGTLKPDEKAALERMLQAFEAAKGSQIGVLLVPTTAPEAIEQYSLRVVEQWKLGRKKIDDGALLIIAKDDRRLRIEVGYGLEGALNDAVSKRIISEVITPRFRQGDFYGGIRDGLARMMQVIEGEPLPPPAGASAPAPDASASGFMAYAPLVLIVALVAGGLLRALFGRFFGALATGALMSVLAWTLFGALVVALLAGIMAFVFTLLGGATRAFRGGHRFGGIGTGFEGLGGRGGFGGGGGGFSSGGGFRGGGGGFGGGGASGRW